MENLIHPSFGSGTDNTNIKTYYYLINGKLFSCFNEVPYKAKTSIKGLDDLNEKWYKIYYNEWEEKLVEIEISDSELEKVKNKVYDFENCAFDAPPINVTDLIDSTYNKEHGIDIYFFKCPEETKNSKIQSDILEIMDSELSLEISEDFPNGIICNRFSCASKIAEYIKNLK